MIGVLLKKQFNESFVSLKHKNKKVDVLGVVLSLFLTVAIVSLVLLVFSKFFKVYSNIKINGELNIKARQFEMLAIIYFVIFLLSIFSGAKAINFAVFEADDLKILMVLPIKSTTLFFSKIFWIYLKQVFISIFTIIPINISFALVAPQGAVYYVMTAVMCLIFPLLTLIVSSALSLPMFYFKRFVQNKYLMSLIFVTAILGVLFWGYSQILQFIKQIIISGDIAFFFSEKVMSTIIKTTTYLAPANFIANALVGIDVGKNLAIILLFAVIGATAGGFIVNSLFSSAIKMRAKTNIKPLFNLQTKKVKQHSLLSALLIKEFYNIYRTPDYTFSYFSTAIIMPLMVYFCIGIGKDLLQTLIFIESNFELAIFIVLMFSVLTNTFCATNISREGNTFYTMKTMPISFKSIVFSKILFCSAISALTIAVSCIIVLSLGYTTALETLFLFVVAILISEAQICFATRKDFNNPTFNDDGEVKESNSTISIVIVLGLLTAILLGGLNLFISVFYGAKGGNSTVVAMLTLMFASLAIFAGAVAYLFVGLDKKYIKLSEGINL
ncbi:MAG: hypothetical protein RR374_05615 [Clostridia bacterium]